MGPVRPAAAKSKIDKTVIENRVHVAAASTAPEERNNKLKQKPRRMDFNFAGKRALVSPAWCRVPPTPAPPRCLIHDPAEAAPDGSPPIESPLHP